MQPEGADIQSHARPRWNTTTKVVVSVILLVLFGLAVYFFRIVFIPLIVGGIVAYLFQPVVRLIRRLTRLPHKVATTLLYLIILALVIPLGILLTPVLIDQVRYLQDESIKVMHQVDALGSSSVQILGFSISTKDLVDEATAAAIATIRSTATRSITLLLNAVEMFLLVIFTLLISFYLTRDAEQMMGWGQGLIPPHYQQDVRKLLGEADQVWSAFFRGQVILSLIVTMIITALSALLGLPQPILMGVLAGLLEFLPSVGHTIWIITALTIALLEGSTWLPIPNHLIFAGLVALAHLVFTQFDLNYLIPRIIGEHVHLHPMVVILGIIVGAVVGGVLGIALAAPTIATLRVFGRYVYAMLFDVEPFLPAPPDRAAVGAGFKPAQPRRRRRADDKAKGDTL